MIVYENHEKEEDDDEEVLDQIDDEISNERPSTV